MKKKFDDDIARLLCSQVHHTGHPGIFRLIVPRDVNLNSSHSSFGTENCDQTTLIRRPRHYHLAFNSIPGRISRITSLWHPEVDISCSWSVKQEL